MISNEEIQRRKHKAIETFIATFGGTYQAQVKGDIDYNRIAREVFLATDAAKLMAQAGLTPPKTTSKSFSVMGKVFDPAAPDAYLNSFAIKRS